MSRVRVLGLSRVRDYRRRLHRPRDTRMVLELTWRLLRRLALILVAVALISPQSRAVASIETEREPNDQWWEAMGPMVPGTTYSGTGDFDGDVDCFYFYVNETSTVTLDFPLARDPFLPGDASLYRYKNGRVELVMTTNARMYTLDLEPDLYVVRMNPWIHVAYEVSVSGSGIGTEPGPGVSPMPLVTESYERNERTWADAGQISDSGAAIVSVVDHEQDDWYYFYVTASSRASLAFSCLDRRNDLVNAIAYRYDDGAMTPLGELSLDVELQPGLHYIRVSSYSEAYEARYSIVISCDELGSTPAQGTPAHPQQHLHGEPISDEWQDAIGPIERSIAHVSYLEQPDDVDWYMFTCGARDNVSIQLSRGDMGRFGSLSAATFRLSGEDLMPVANGTFVGDLDPGTYFVEVSGADSDVPYLLVVTGQSLAMRRVAGPDRYATAVAASQANFEGAYTVVLATGASFPDALAASGLAGVYDGPLLLTRRDTLPADVRDEIARLDARRVILVGGTGAISDSVRDAVGALEGVSVERIAGPSRYATAAAIARRIEQETGTSFIKKAFVVTGNGFADALSVSPPAYQKGIPILLTRPTSANSETKDAIRDLGIEEVIIAGGQGAVSDAVKDDLAVPSVRVAGPDRYATAVEVATFSAARDWSNTGFIGIATGANFPDALGGGAATGRNGGSLLLSRRGELPTQAAQLIESDRLDIEHVQVYGGADAVGEAVASAVCEQLPRYPQ